MIRSPFLSVEEGRALLNGPDWVGRALADPFISLIIKTASPDLYGVLAAPAPDATKTTAIRRAAFDVLSRMTFRTAPYSCFGGVSLAPVGRIKSQNASDQIIFREKGRYLRSFLGRGGRPGETHLEPNPTLLFHGGAATFIQSRANSPGQPPSPLYVESSFFVPEALKKLLLEDPDSLPERFAQELIGLGLLWRVPSPKKDRRAPFAVESLADSVVGRKPRRTEPLRVDMFKPCVQDRVPDHVVSSFGKSAEILIAAFGHMALLKDGARRLESMKKAFLERYERQEVPLLELLGPNSDVGRAFRNDPGQVVPVKAVEDYLADLVLDYKVQQTGILRLESRHIDRLREISVSEGMPAPMPDSFVVLGETVQIDGQSERRFVLKELTGPHGVRHFSRYLQLDEGLRRAAVELARAEEALHPDAVFAEIMHVPELASARNIIPETGLYAGCVIVSKPTSRARSVRLDLSDLQVSLGAEGFRIRSARLNKRIIPVLTSLYNFESDSHPVFHFLSALESQNSFVHVHWAWGSLQRFPRLPRVEYKNVLFSPARWRITNSLMQSFRAEDRAGHSIEPILTAMGVPRSFELYDHSAGVKMRFDRSNPQSKDSFLHSLHENHLIDVQECFEPVGVSGPEGRYCHDYVIPFVRKEPQRLRDLGYHFEKHRLPPPIESEVTFNPGGRWCSFDIAVPQALADSFIANQLNSMRPLLGREWFFLQYRDSRFHLRLRAHDVRADRIASLLNRFVKSGACSGFEMKTYRREIERYGGIRGCELFERLSHFDSEAAVGAAGVFLDSNLPKDELWAYAALYSVEYYLESFGFDRGEALGLLSSPVRETWAASRARSRPTFFNSYKRSRLRGEVALPREQQKLESIYRRRMKDQARSFKELDRLSSGGGLLSTKGSYFDSLVHLSLVRLDLELDRECEALIRSVVGDVVRNRPRDAAGPR